MKFSKQLVLCAALMFAFTGMAKAKGGAAPAFDKGSKTIGIFLGAGVDYSYNHGYFNEATSSFIPAIGVYYDQGIIGNVGPGTIGIGGMVAYKGDHRKYKGDTYDYNSVLVAVRGTYHLTILKDKNNKFDPYAGLTAGIRFSNFKNSYDSYTNNSPAPIAGAFIGAKYNFTPAIGAFAEAGYDITLIRLGINFNF